MSPIQKLTTKSVPGNGCTLYYQSDAIRFEEEDTVADYQTEPHPFIPGALTLAHKHNGECVYLNDRGCTIHERAPSLCQIADCRTVAAHLDFETAQSLHSLGKLDIRVGDTRRRLLEAIQFDVEKP